MYDVIKVIKRLKDLDCIMLWISSGDANGTSVDETALLSLDQMVIVAQEVLAVSLSKKRKILVVRCAEEDIRIVVDQAGEV